MLARFLGALRRPVFHDFADRHAACAPSIKSGLGRVLRMRTLGQLQAYVEEFEGDFARRLPVAHALGQASGTAALHLALMQAGVRPGSEVVTVANTWVTTLTVVHELGARCRFVDVDPETGMMDAAGLEQAITPATAAIVPVHMYGSMAPISRIVAIARARGVPVIEDACQAIGASLDGRAAGTWGDAGCFSFHATKLVGAPCDGGMIVTARADWAQQLRRASVADWGSALVTAQPCVPSRLSPLAIPFLAANLAALDRQIALRAAQVKYYESLLQDVAQVRLLRAPDGVLRSHRNCILVSPYKPAILAACRSAGLPVEQIYPTTAELVERLQSGGARLPNTAALARDHLALPLGAATSQRLQRRLAAVVRDACRPVMVAAAPQVAS